MKALSRVKRFISGISKLRKAVYGVLVIGLIIAIIAKLQILHRTALYKRGTATLEDALRQQSRFRDVQVHFVPTRPSAYILAPDSLSQVDKDALLQLVAGSFDSLPCPRIQYAGTNFFGTQITNLQQSGNVR